MIVIFVTHFNQFFDTQCSYSRSVTSDDVSLKITHCGVCYADVIWTRNKLGDSKYPLIPGYVLQNPNSKSSIFNLLVYLMFLCFFLSKA